MVNYDTLKKAVDDAKLAYDTQNNLVSQLRAQVDVLKATLDRVEESAKKYDVTYFENLLAEQRAYEDKKKQYPLDIAKQLK